MAQLPPKVPNMTPNWSGFPHQRIVSMENLSPNTTTTNPSWMDEFLDFSSTKRGTHRRSSSDTVAFLDAPMVQSCRSMAAGVGGHEMDRDDFEGFDDEQIMSMFVDDAPVGPASSNTSDHNSINEDNNNNQVGGVGGQVQMMKQLKSEADEMQSSGDSEAQIGNNGLTDNSSENKIFDPKRVKRILANRQSAQRSRVRKLQYISELERSVTSLQTEVSVMSPRVAYLDHQRLMLTVDNSNLQQRLAALAQDKIFKDAHQEALRREIERLRKVYQDQNQEKMENGTTSQPPQPSSDGNASTKSEHQDRNFPPPL